MALGGAGTELLEAAGMALLGGVGVMAAVGSGCSGRCCASFFTSLSSNSEKEGLGDRSPPSGSVLGYAECRCLHAACSHALFEHFAQEWEVEAQPL